MQRPVGVNIVAVLDIISAAFLLLLAVAMLAGKIVSGSISDISLEILGGMFCTLLAVVFAICGYGLLKLRPWARPLTFFLATVEILATAYFLKEPAFRQSMFSTASLVERVAIDAVVIWYFTRPRVKLAFAASGSAIGKGPSR